MRMIRYFLFVVVTLGINLVESRESPRSQKKRWLHCFGTSPEGCTYGTVGSSAVATEVGTCSEAGVDALLKGGNAIDALITSILCVGTIAAYHSGVGGGGFGVVRSTTENGSHAYESINFREMAPAASNVTMFSQYGVNQTQSTVGGLSVGVPGELAGLWSLSQRYGRLPWSDLFQPAIRLARDGFPVNADLAFNIQQAESLILSEPLWAESYARHGKILQEGDIVYRHRYARTLERISLEGPDAFYTGAIAANIIKAVQSSGGIMTSADLASYRVISETPSNITYRGNKLYSTRAPSSGAITLSALKIYEGFNGSFSEDSPTGRLGTQELIESVKFAYGQRATLGDPLYTKNVTALEASYTSEHIAALARQHIVPGRTFTPEYYNPSGYYPSRESGTSHMAAVDSDGFGISITTTINLLWGSQIMTEDGIILNDQMDDFGTPGQLNALGYQPSPVNFVEPGKRPQSSISSVLVENEHGELIFLSGSAGGSRIITTTVQELHNYLDLRLNATECTTHPRWHDQLGGTTFFEYSVPSKGLTGYSNNTVDALRDMGYNISYEDPYGYFASVSQAIGRLETGKWLGASDPRKSAGRAAAV